MTWALIIAMTFGSAITTTSSLRYPTEFECREAGRMAQEQFTAEGLAIAFACVPAGEIYQ